MCSEAEKNRILAYVTGLLYFYGVARLADLYNIVQKTLQSDLPLAGFQALLESNVLDIDSPYVFDREGDIYFDTEVENPEWVMEEQAKRDELYFRPVTEEEARSVVEDKYPLLWDETERQFYRWIEGVCGSDREIAATLFLGYQAQVRNNVHPLELAKKLLIDMNICDLVEIKELASLVMEFYNHVPLWTLKGWRTIDVSAGGQV